MKNDYWNRPCASAGLTSFRYCGSYGWIMIGAHNVPDALREASRSTEKHTSEVSKLQVWDGQQYKPVQE